MNKEDDKEFGTSKLKSVLRVDASPCFAYYKVLFYEGDLTKSLHSEKLRDTL